MGLTLVPTRCAMPRARRPWAMVRLGMAKPTNGSADTFPAFPTVFKATLPTRQLALRRPAWPEQVRAPPVLRSPALTPP